MLLHVVREFGKFLGGDPQCLRGLTAYGRHHLVVQVLDEFRDLFFEALGRVVDGLAHAAEAPSTLRLKSFMVLLTSDWRETVHADCGCQARLLFRAPNGGSMGSR